MTSLIIDLMKVLHASIFPKGIGISPNGGATFFNSLAQNSNGLVMNGSRFFCCQSLGRSSWMNLSSPENLIHIDIAGPEPSEQDFDLQVFQSALAKSSYQGLV
ncbi:formamidopyrimidine-DNA glycosylase [Streptococcus pneumoniae]|nr:formamidopyrimidine-DNA glycosylase [Streptococcus pneumoniae]